MTRSFVFKVLTPEFIHYNEIVPVHWELEKPVFLSAGFTEMGFDSGLTIQVDESEAAFFVAVREWPGQEVPICNDVVRRLLEILPGLDPTEFSQHIMGYALMPEGSPGIVNIGTSLDEQLPVVSHCSTFYFPERRVTFEAREVSRNRVRFINCLDFSFRSFCSSSMVPDEPLTGVLDEALDEWEGLLNQFVALADGFYSRHIESE